MVALRKEKDGEGSKATENLTLCFFKRQQRKNTTLLKIIILISERILLKKIYCTAPQLLLLLPHLVRAQKLQTVAFGGDIALQVNNLAAAAVNSLPA
jgi:hypothetical protein